MACVEQFSIRYAHVFTFNSQICFSDRYMRAWRTCGADWIREYIDILVWINSAMSESWFWDTYYNGHARKAKACNKHDSAVFYFPQVFPSYIGGRKSPVASYFSHPLYILCISTNTRYSFYCVAALLCIKQYILLVLILNLWKISRKLKDFHRLNRDCHT